MIEHINYFVSNSNPRPDVLKYKYLSRKGFMHDQSSLNDPERDEIRSKLSKISLTKRLVKLRITILKYHSLYLYPILLQIMLLPIQTTPDRHVCVVCP